MTCMLMIHRDMNSCYSQALEIGRKEVELNNVSMPWTLAAFSWQWHNHCWQDEQVWPGVTRCDRVSQGVTGWVSPGVTGGGAGRDADGQHLFTNSSYLIVHFHTIVTRPRHLSPLDRHRNSPTQHTQTGKNTHFTVYIQRSFHTKCITNLYNY